MEKYRKKEVRVRDRHNRASGKWKNEGRKIYSRGKFRIDIQDTWKKEKGEIEEKMIKNVREEKIKLKK